MAVVSLEIFGTRRISARALNAGVQQTVGLLDEYDKATAERSTARFRWNVDHLNSNGSLFLNFKSELIPKRGKIQLKDESQYVATSLISGLDTIDRKAVMPPFITESGMNRVQHLVELINKEEVDAYTIRADSLEASVTKSTQESLSKLIEIKREAIGVVEGRLVAISVASQRPKLTIIHQRTKRAISCQLDESHLEMAKNYLGETVIARGTLLKNGNGDTIRIGVDDGNLRMPSRDDFYRRLSLISSLPVPEFAELTDTDEYLTQTRGE